MKKRSAGILMHITSLPSKFGSGDLGPEAYNFADFLKRSNQHYWQILPLNPTDVGSGYSPYSSNSSMAGNTILISPEKLIDDGLMDEEDVAAIEISEQVDFKTAERLRKEIFKTAYKNFSSSGKLKQEFEFFKDEEDHWLHDYALFLTLKTKFNNSAWHEWPNEFKNRDTEELNYFSEDNAEELEKIKWQQYIFFRQWKQLKSYCNARDISIVGDLPFYVSHDSVDVWANPEFFNLDENGKMIGVAGVPPDYFNEDGQLWGMPVFKWKKLKKKKYSWWIRRINRNIQFFDLLRLDHFRAFYDYWEVPQGEETAINGEWKKGPGNHFFKKLKKKFYDLPFIAEDLGDVHQKVYYLRDKFGLPGMKVVQFAFGDDIATSEHIPHNFAKNFIAYTGTHDNNTTLGWFKNDIGEKEKYNIYSYTGIKPMEENIHDILSQLVYASVAQVAILPIQDVLGLDEKSRMNTPASTEKNWVWRLKSEQIDQSIEEKLKKWIKIFNR